MAEKRKDVLVPDPDNAHDWQGGRRVGEEPYEPGDPRAGARTETEAELREAKARVAELETELETMPTEWQPPAGEIVTDDKSLFILIGKDRYEHVSEAPDGRWVYRKS